MKKNIWWIIFPCILVVLVVYSVSVKSTSEIYKAFQEVDSEKQKIFATQEVERGLNQLIQNKETAINGGFRLVKKLLTSAKDIGADVSDLESRFSIIEKDILNNEIDKVLNARYDDLDITFLLRTLKIYELAKSAGIDVTTLKKNIHEIERKLFDKKMSETLKKTIS